VHDFRVQRRNLLITITSPAPEGTYLIERLLTSVSELMCYPGYEDAELDGVKTRLRASLTNELRLLVAPVERRICSKAWIKHSYTLTNKMELHVRLYYGDKLLAAIIE